MKELIQKKETKYVREVPYWLKDSKRSAVVALSTKDECVCFLKHTYHNQELCFKWLSVNVGSGADLSIPHKNIQDACDEALSEGWRVLFLGEEKDTKFGENKEVFDIFSSLK